MTAEIAEPGDAAASRCRLQPFEATEPASSSDKRRARIVAGLHVEQQRHVGDVARPSAPRRPSAHERLRWSGPPGTQPVRRCGSRRHCSRRPDCAASRRSRCHRRPAPCRAPAPPPRRRSSRRRSAAGSKALQRRRRTRRCRCCEPSPNSGTLVLPMMMAPALRMRSTTKLVLLRHEIGEDAASRKWSCRPLVSARSLMAIGRPNSGPGSPPVGQPGVGGRRPRAGCRRARAARRWR